MKRQLFINNEPAEEGMSVTTSSGDQGTLTGWREPHKPGSTGRVYVRFEGWSSDREFFPNVIGGKWKEVAE